MMTASVLMGWFRWVEVLVAGQKTWCERSPRVGWKSGKIAGGAADAVAVDGDGGNAIAIVEAAAVEIPYCDGTSRGPRRNRRLLWPFLCQSEMVWCVYSGCARSAVESGGHDRRQAGSNKASARLFNLTKTRRKLSMGKENKWQQ